MKNLANAKTPKEDEGYEVLKAEVARQGKVLGFLCRKLEQYFGQDFNGDGKIGAVRIMTLLCVLFAGIIACTSYALTPLADTNAVVQYTDNTGTNYIYTLDKSGNVRNSGTITSSGAISAVPTGSGAVTSSLATTTSAAESYPENHTTVITLSSTPILITANATTNAYGGTKIYDFPAGRILVYGVTVDGIDFTCGINLTNTGGGDFSFGTAVATSNALTSTMVDLCPSTSIDTLTNVVNSALAASAQFDGTSTAKDMYINFGIDNGDHTASTVSTNTVDGVVTVNWINLGDY